MALEIKFKCPQCGGSKYEEGIDHKRGHRRCMGDAVGSQRERSIHGPMYDVHPCQFTWLMAEDYKYFVAEVTFATDGAYQLALKAKQVGGALAFLKTNLTSG